MSARDPRVTLAKPGLAAAELEGRLAAPRYAVPRRLAVVVAAAPLWRAPDAAAERVDELLLGEAFDAMEEDGAFVWGQARRDGCVGYARAVDLGPVGAAPTHRVAAIRTYAFAEPSIRSAAAGPFSLNALVAVAAEEGPFARDAAGRWFWAGHLAPIGRFEPEPAAVAERFVGAPYLWGGRTSVGLDSAGLVQQALYACGRACPRSADQQAELGRAVGQVELARGDLVCWADHVAMMLDGARLIHASAHHMAVVIEPAAGAIARIGAERGPPTAFRRL